MVRMLSTGASDFALSVDAIDVGVLGEQVPVRRERELRASRISPGGILDVVGAIAARPHFPLNLFLLAKHA
jgi:hypothetical protein